MCNAISTQNTKCFYMLDYVLLVHSANDVRALKTSRSDLNLFYYQEIDKRPKITTNYKSQEYDVFKKMCLIYDYYLLYIMMTTSAGSSLNEWLPAV